MLSLCIYRLFHASYSLQKTELKLLSFHYDVISQHAWPAINQTNQFAVINLAKVRSISNQGIRSSRITECTRLTAESNSSSWRLGCQESTKHKIMVLSAGGRKRHSFLRRTGKKNRWQKSGRQSSAAARTGTCSTTGECKKQAGTPYTQLFAIFKLQAMIYAGLW